MWIHVHRAAARLLLCALFVCLTLGFGLPAWAGGVNINSASAAELDTLPGIGPAKAQAIIEHRTQQGPFASIESIQDVTGIGPATFNNMKTLITVGVGTTEDGSPDGGDAAPAPPAAETPPAAPPTGQVDINTATEDALQTLPGIGPSKAAAIIADRTNQGPFGSCDDLTRVTGIGPATVANLSGQCITE